MHKNAKNTFSKIFQFFQPMTLLEIVRLRKLKLSRYLRNILFSYQKKFGGKILINNKDIKVLLTEGTKPMSKIIEKFLTMKIPTLC